jgi:peroxiredoxin family protein
MQQLIQAADKRTTPSTPDTLEQRLDVLEDAMAELRRNVPDSGKVTLLFFSSDLDKVLAGLIIAATAASMGMQVTAFFTFWGINVLKKQRIMTSKTLPERLLGLVTPAGPARMPVSRMNMLGAGRSMLTAMMKHRRVASADELLQLAVEHDVRLVACSTTLQVMGIHREELLDAAEVAGAAAYLGDASRSGCTLFI